MRKIPNKVDSILADLQMVNEPEVFMYCFYVLFCFVVFVTI